MRSLLIGSAVLAVLPLVGCATSKDIAGTTGPRVYGGTQTDLALISGQLGPTNHADEERARRISGPVKTWAACCGLADLPFSFVADTLLLPVTMSQANTRAEAQAAAESEPEYVDREY